MLFMSRGVLACPMGGWNSGLGTPQRQVLIGRLAQGGAHASAPGHGRATWRSLVRSSVASMAVVARSE